MNFCGSKPGKLRSVGFQKAFLLLSLSFGLLLLALPTFAQSNLGRIFGAVTDQSGGAIAGATVSVIDVDRGITRPLVSDGAGQFDASSLIPGTYTVRVEAKGFKLEEHTAIEVGVGKEVRVDLVLQPGEQTTTVTVTGELPLVNTSNAELSRTLEDIAVQELPVNGRNYQYLAFTRPGVIMTPSAGQQDFSDDGMRNNMVVWLIDGLMDSNLFVGSPSLVGGGQLGPDQATIMPLDAIQEVDMVEMPTAEYGDKPGAHIDVGLKSGTNTLHGTAYAFGRDTALNAKNPFLTSVEPKAPLALKQYGASVGGPIKKDKVFYFGNYEGQRYTVGVPSIYTLPTTAPGAGTTFSIPDALNDILTHYSGPTSVAPSALSMNLSGCSALVNSVGGVTSGNFTNAQVLSLKAMYPTSASLAAGCSASNPLTAIFGNSNSGSVLPAQDSLEDLTTSGGSDNGIIKVDVHLNDKNSLNFDWYSGGGNGLVGSQIEPYWSSQLHTWANMGRAVWIWTPSSTWLNEFRFGYDYGNYPTYVLECDKPGIGPNYPSLGFVSGAKPCGPESSGPGFDVYGGFPNATISGFTGFGPQGIRQDSFQHYFAIMDNVSWTHGKHTIKFGPETHFMYFNSAALQGVNGTLTFGGGGSQSPFAGATALEDFLSGVTNTGTIQAGDPNRNTQIASFEFYVQDSWRISPRVTINAGLRYSYLGPYSDPKPNPAGQPAYLLGNFNPALGTATDLYQDSKSHPDVYSTNPYNFGPRLGVAWDVFGNGKTVVHVGASLMYFDSPVGIQMFMPGAAVLNGVPTGFTFFNPNGSSFAGPGTISSGSISQAGGLPGASTNQLPWLINTPVFSGLGPSSLECGNGAPSAAAPGGAAPGAPTVNPSPCELQVYNPGRSPLSRFFTRTLSVQHAFTNNLTLDVAYVGNHGWALFGPIDDNAPTLGANVTTIPTTCVGNTAAAQCRRPYQSQFPFYSDIFLETNFQMSNYDALQIVLTHRLSHGLQITPGFTWSHQLDDGGQGPALTNPYNPILSYGTDSIPGIDFNMTATYYIPGKKMKGQLLEGWQVNTTVYALGGYPTTATDTVDNLSGFGGAATDRWTLVGPGSAFKIGGPGAPSAGGPITCYGIPGSTFGNAANCTKVNTPAGCTPSAITSAAQAIGCVSGMPAQCISAAAGEATNISAASGVTAATKNSTGPWSLANIGCYVAGNSVFVPPAQGTIGTESRGALLTKPFKNWDFSATKNWKFRERYGVQFRAEFFNVLNRTLYRTPGVALNSPSNFGESLATPDSGNPVIGFGPRKIQFGLKLSF
jgi:hypothetical protein